MKIDTQLPVTASADTRHASGAYRGHRDPDYRNR